MKKSFLIAFALLCCEQFQAQEKKFNLVIGTYTKSCESKGIYVYDFDAETGVSQFKSATENIINPSFVTVSKKNDFVYSVNEDGPKSTVSAFSYDSKNAKLDFLNKQKIQNPGPCYIINDDKNVITANYTGGSVAVFGKNKNGSLTELKQLIEHSGKGVNPARQEKSHVHSVQFSPDHKLVLATDLGTDKLYVYQYDSKAVKPLALKDSISVKAGSGPRHFVFSKNGRKLYLLQELDGTLSVFDYKKGKMQLVQETTVVADGFTKPFTAADIHISPDEKFLYATNRKEANTISCFKILKDGKLALASRISTLGDGPRNFAIDPSGNFLLVGHQYTNNVVVFKRNKETGALTDTGKRIELCAPVCLVFTEK
ncbi:lactonase family protein [Flavobacterium daejeonense]|uniref:lactonase family protein n=1 Tax=Flavobacterium daejeonense TaxID=350893 RepID=UPI00047E6DF7|nr:lactonase family protein [Flavobacterium daejeonense]